MNLELHEHQCTVRCSAGNALSVRRRPRLFSRPCDVYVSEELQARHRAVWHANLRRTWYPLFGEAVTPAPSWSHFFPAIALSDSRE